MPQELYTVSMPLNLTAADDDDGRRLDRILRKALPDLPLSAIHRLLRKGRVLADGRKAAAGHIVRKGESIAVAADSAVGEAAAAEPKVRQNRRLPPAQKIPEIIFEGAGLLVLNKPAGLAVHGEESLEDIVLSYLAPKLPRSLSFKPGPLHRLDKPSSGLIVFSANLDGARFFSAMMRERRIKKYYIALAGGIIKAEEIWRDELFRNEAQRKTFAGQFPGTSGNSGVLKASGGALTRVKPLAAGAACTLLLAEIETGRTHQIRAQAASRGHPLCGDKKYGGRPLPGKPLPGNPGQSGSGAFLLHAWRMELPGDFPGFSSETAASRPRVLEAPLPDYFRKKIKELFGDIALFNN